MKLFKLSAIQYSVFSEKSALQLSRYLHTMIFTLFTHKCSMQISRIQLVKLFNGKFDESLNKKFDAISSTKDDYTEQCCCYVETSSMLREIALIAWGRTWLQILQLRSLTKRYWRYRYLMNQTDYQLKLYKAHANNSHSWRLRFFTRWFLLTQAHKTDVE